MILIEANPHRPDFLSGGGEMGARMRELDWSRTALGPPSAWPQSLRSPVSMLLPSKAQIILFWGSEFTCLYNDAYREVFGAKHPHALGRPGREAWSEIWDTQLHALLDGVVNTGDAFHARDLLFVLERYGFVEDTYFDVSYDPVRDESGAVGGVYCIVTETTGRVVGERRLALLRDLAANNATTRSTREACTLAMQTFASRPDDVPFALAYLDDELQATTSGAQQALDAAPRQTARELALPNGKLVIGLNPRRPFDEQYASFLELVAGQLATSIANAKAHEEERRRSEALADLDRAKTAFFSNVSHEFRTPLTLLLGPVEDALASSNSPADRERLELIHRNALRLLRLVNALLDFSRIEAGRMQAELVATDLAAYTADLASGFRSVIERAGLRLSVDTGSIADLPAVYIDCEMWEKIVLNLLSNAFKHTFDGEIRVRLEARGDKVVLQVRDTGVGIEPEELTRVFERFHRVPNARSRTNEGTGIGLALVQELVKLHGGTIGVESTVGKGTTFTVVIPRGSPNAAGNGQSTGALPQVAGSSAAFVEEALRWLPGEDENHQVSGPVAPSTDCRILFADDNSDMRSYVTRLLREQGWIVDAVADGRTALETARAELPDLVLADVMMPGLDGFQLLRALREEGPTSSIPVILLSARAGEESRVEGLRVGADDYLVKPFSAPELVARVAAKLDGARKLRDDRRQAEERERLLAEVENANRSKSDFLAAMSHELRTPLNAIGGHVQLLEMEVHGTLTDPQREALVRVQRNQQHLLGLINDILNFAKVEAGRVEYRIEDVSVADIVTDVLKMIEPQLKSRGLQTDVRVAPDIIVRADREKLDQILLNLLSNAAKFTGAGGRVSIHVSAAQPSAQSTEGVVLIDVTDTGIGIPADKQESIFDPFVQVHRGLKGKSQGTGLGLSISRNLARGMLGDLTVRSTEGQGSTFTLSLPAAPRAV